MAIIFPIPKIGEMGDKARILYFHVPLAWVATLSFIMSLIYSVRYLRKRDEIYDIKSSSAAGIGLLFAVLATVTGAVWARFEWGAFWNWDPRQTAIFMLILIYGAYFALRASMDSREKRARLSSVYAILAGITVPFFIFVMPRITETLHPDPIINTRGKVNMSSDMLLVFLASLAGFTGLYFWILSLKVRIEKLKLKKIS
ncbi:MAG: cytochrome c biogenesis protein [Ignavibacteria bacterium]|nr:cytochrome c biogenesis protein [Ignavibacteria bacterium]